MNGDKKVLQFRNKALTGELTAINHSELGSLGLNNQEVNDVVAYLNTLTDGWQPSYNR